VEAAWTFGSAAAEFASAKLGHRARNARAARFAEAMLRMPTASIPKMLNDCHQAKRTYSFLSNPMVTHSALLSGHIAATTQRCAKERTVLLVADSSDLDFSTHPAIRGLTPLADPWSQGLLMHTTLAVSAEAQEVLGVLDQFVWTHAAGPSKRSQKESSYARKNRPRESQRWGAAVSRVHELLQAFEVQSSVDTVRYLVVGDRETDNFDLFRTVLETRHGFVFRVYQNRMLFDEDRASPRYLIDEVLKTPVKATKTVRVPPRRGQPARSATLEVRAMQASIAPPQNSNRKGAAVSARIIAAVEIGAPTEEKTPLCWYLLTSEPIETAEQLLQVVRHYEARWLVEEFHMGIKSGCATEKRQFESRHAIENFLAFAVVIAVSLLRLRDVARRPEPIPASTVLTPTQYEVLRHLRPKFLKNGSARDALRAIATLGGFMGRKGDGEPGWRTMWRGFEILLIAETGFLIPHRNH
jgi:hypothetical protein